jgi:hypothetical protein
VCACDWATVLCTLISVSLTYARFGSTERPPTSFLWFLSPWRSFRYIIWANFKWYIIAAIVLILVAIFLILFFYSVPSAVVTKYWRGDVVVVVEKLDDRWDAEAIT